MATEKRTDQEIVARIEEISGTDMFGSKTVVLLPYLEFEAAKPYLADTVTEREWGEIRSGVRTPAEEGAAYVEFAVGKMENERGLSANRSVDKFAEWAWLDGEDELARQIDDPDNYGWYGDWAVKLYVDHYGLPMPERLAGV